jgi:hypothetical protein
MSIKTVYKQNQTGHSRRNQPVGLVCSSCRLVQTAQWPHEHAMAARLRTAEHRRAPPRIGLHRPQWPTQWTQRTSTRLQINAHHSSLNFVVSLYFSDG